jgi:small subunit ribosomal protein S4
MARYIGPVCKHCRRENLKLFLKGERCYTDKCAFDRRPFPSGVHGQRRGKFSEYGVRMREKQKVRRVYGVLERQFRRYFEMADRAKGVTGENLLRILERRLDNVCYNLGLGVTRNDTRQLVRHRHVMINGKIVNIPSYLVRPGDKITLRERSQKLKRVESALENTSQRAIPEWLEFDKENLTGIVKTLPNRESVAVPIQERFVVEFYSR